VFFNEQSQGRKRETTDAERFDHWEDCGISCREPFRYEKHLQWKATKMNLVEKDKEPEGSVPGFLSVTATFNSMVRDRSAVLWKPMDAASESRE